MWSTKDIAKGVAVAVIIGLLGWIAVNTKDVPTMKEKQAEEVRLREGRDESLQRQVSKLNDKIQTLEIEIAKQK